MDTTNKNIKSVKKKAAKDKMPALNPGPVLYPGKPKSHPTKDSNRRKRNIGRS